MDKVYLIEQHKTRITYYLDESVPSYDRRIDEFFDTEEEATRAFQELPKKLTGSYEQSVCSK